MDTLSQFRTLDELIRALDKERKLLFELFEMRKSVSLRTDMAMEYVEYKRERIQYLIDYGIIHETGNFIELESVYLQFFEEVLDVNEEINIESVRDAISALKEQIQYFLAETNEQRKYHYQHQVRQLLRKTGLRTLKNVIDLKRNVESAYKQEPNYAIKKQRLNNLDKKSESIKMLIRECEKLLDKEVVFFSVVADPEMERTRQDVQADFSEAYHNLLEIDKQIIVYLNQIEQQNKLCKQIRRIKYLKDQYRWNADTNVRQVLEEMNPVWMENRPYNITRLSLDNLRSSDEMAALLQKIASTEKIRQQSRTTAEAFTEDEMAEHSAELPLINPNEVWNAFAASSYDLFNFVMQYDYPIERTLSDHLTLFCQLAVTHPAECRITNKYNSYLNIEYPLIYAK